MNTPELLATAALAAIDSTRRLARRSAELETVLDVLVERAPASA